VKLIDHGRGAYDPGIRLARLGILALFGAEDGGLLLGFADEEDALGTLETGPVLQGDVLLALTFGEGEQRDLVLLGKLLHAGDERLGDRVHQCRGGEGMAAVEAEESGNAGLVLQLWLVNV